MQPGVIPCHLIALTGCRAAKAEVEALQVRVSQQDGEIHLLESTVQSDLESSQAAILKQETAMELLRAATANANAASAVTIEQHISQIASLSAQCADLESSLQHERAAHLTLQSQAEDLRTEMVTFRAAAMVEREVRPLISVHFCNLSNRLR